MNDYMRALHQRFFREPAYPEVREEIEHLRRELREQLDRQDREKLLKLVNTPPETVPLDRTNGAPRPLKWCMVTAAMVH